jgi:molybdopterin adenylyltransferase
LPKRDDAHAAALTLARIGILVISDRASRGEYEDKSGEAISGFLKGAPRSDWIAVVRIIPDGAENVAEILVETITSTAE